MLQVSRRGSVQDVAELSTQEDHALRQAFGRFGDPEARAAGAEVVHCYQRAGAGSWVLCDCLGRLDQPLALIPVAKAHIRRHYDPPWPEHDPDCDFLPRRGAAAYGYAQRAGHRHRRGREPGGVPLHLPPALAEFLLRIGQVAPSRFRSSGRPHGVLVSVAADASLGSLRPLRGEPIPVRGETAIFGRSGAARPADVGGAAGALVPSGPLPG